MFKKLKKRDTFVENFIHLVDRFIQSTNGNYKSW